MSNIGIGIITCNRPEFFKKCRKSIKEEWYNHLVIVNDGKGPIFDAFAPIIKTKGGEGVGKAKNLAIEYLLEQGCDYIILVEDDMLFKGNIFEQYIKAHKETGIHHFMFAYHGPANKAGISGGKPVPRKVIDYGKIKIALNQHCVGAVCFYTRQCLDKIGLYDESYTNAFEHVDHSYELAKAEYSTPYWWWADIENSLDYVQEQACSEDNSAIRPRSDWQSNIQKSAVRFSKKHGVSPVQVADTPVQEVINKLKKIKNENRPVLSK
jgi:GT2 family glycosyltransferase